MDENYLASSKDKEIIDLTLSFLNKTNENFPIEEFLSGPLYLGHGIYEEKEPNKLCGIAYFSNKSLAEKIADKLSQLKSNHFEVAYTDHNDPYVREEFRGLDAGWIILLEAGKYVLKDMNSIKILKD